MTPDHDLDRLVQRVFGQRDREALGALLTAERPFLRAILARALGSAVESGELDELAQEVVLRVLQSATPALPGTLSEFRAWFSRVAWNKAREQFGKDALASAAFPYEQLLAFYRGKLPPGACAEVVRQLETSPRWRAHHESVRLLDLE